MVPGEGSRGRSAGAPEALEYMRPFKWPKGALININRRKYKCQQTTQFIKIKMTSDFSQHHTSDTTSSDCSAPDLVAEMIFP